MKKQITLIIVFFLILISTVRAMTITKVTNFPDTDNARIMGATSTHIFTFCKHSSRHKLYISSDGVTWNKIWEAPDDDHLITRMGQGSGDMYFITSTPDYNVMRYSNEKKMIAVSPDNLAEKGDIFEYDGYLYLSSYSSSGFNLYRAALPVNNANAANWTQISNSGFGNSDFAWAPILTEFKNDLYLITHDGFVANDEIRIYSSSDGVNFSLAHTVSDVRFVESHKTAIYNNELYFVYSRDSDGNVIILKTADGVNWSEAYNDSVDCPYLPFRRGEPAVLGGYLYYVSPDSAGNGSTLIRCSNNTWEVTRCAALDRSYYEQADAYSCEVFNDKLYIGAQASGGVVYAGVADGTPHPAYPKNAVVYTNAIEWRWYDFASNETKYFVSTSNGLTDISSTLPTDMSNWAETGLNVNTYYARSVKTFNLDGENLSQVMERYTLARVPGAAAFDISSNSIRVNWTANGNPGGTEYQAQNMTESINSAWITTFSWDNTGLSPNTFYTYQVRARNGDNVTTTYTSLGSTYTYANVPGTPDVLCGKGNFILICIDTNFNPPSTEYAVYNQTLSRWLQNDGSLGGSEAWQTYADWGGAAGATNNSLPDPNKQYTYTVKARNNDDIETALSSSDTAYSYCNDPVFSLFSNITSNSITLSWTSGGNPGGTEYRASNANTGQISSWSTALSWTCSSLLPNSNYTFYCQARNNDGTNTSFIIMGSAYTHANPPSAPTVQTNTPQSLKIIINENNNPAGT
ncbi:MAG TPA: fibronectin type III domain-containing protein, partial [Spirochaetota bacterium]|nr:fibronectin type III domain-containing protein [Spirochaetota bacterium]